MPLGMLPVFGFVKLGDYLLEFFFVIFAHRDSTLAVTPDFRFISLSHQMFHASNRQIVLVCYLDENVLDRLVNFVAF